MQNMLLQGYFWGVANILFDKHPQNFDILVDEIKKAKLDIDIEQLRKDALSKEIDDIIQNDIETVTKREINGTPAIEINGVIYMGAMPYDELLKEIDLAQKRATNK